MTIAIIGAGIAGASAAAVLVGAGERVVVLDKGRAPGGRLATRHSREGYVFDHGAPYVAVSEPPMLRAALRTAEGGAADDRSASVAAWPPAGRDARIGVPGMGAIVCRLLTGADVREGHEVSHIERADRWRLTVRDHGTLEADTLLVTAPAPQTAALLASVHPGLAEGASRAVYEPCWTVMLAFEGVPDGRDAIVRPDGGPLESIVANATKEGRTPNTVVAHARPDWSAQHVEASADDVLSPLAAAVSAHLGVGAPIYAAAHRWRYARVSRAADVLPYDREARIGCAGDWCLGPTVADACRSGIATGSAVLDAR